MDDLRTKFGALSARQRQVMELAASGLSSKEIARQLEISAKTVKTIAPGSWSGSVRATSPNSCASPSRSSAAPSRRSDFPPRIGENTQVFASPLDGRFA